MAVWLQKSKIKILGLLLAMVLVPSLGWSDCSTSSPTGYRKTVAVTGFPFLVPNHANLGNIANAEIRFPQRLANKLNLSGEHIALDVSDMTVRSMERPQQGYASHFNDELSNEYSLSLPEAQFVLSGVITDAGETIQKPDSVKTFFVRQKAFLLQQKRYIPRHFELQLTLHSRYTGELIYKKRYETSANWEYRKNLNVGVDGPLFWRTEYGQEVQRLLDVAVNDIEIEMTCARLMARVNKVLGKGVVLSAMPQANIRKGDTLKLYKVNQKAEAALFDAGEGALVEVMGLNARGVIAKFQGINQWSIRVGDIVGAL